MTTNRMTSRWLSDHWGWVVTGATCVAFFFSYGFIFSFSVLFVTFQKEFNSSATATAWVGSLPFGLSAIASPPINLLIERIGCHHVVVIGILTLMTSLIVTSFMTSLISMYFTYSALYGLGAGCILFGSLKLILEYFPVRHSTGAVVLPMASSNLGMLSLGPLTFFLENRFGWRNAVRIIAAMIGCLALPACALAHREPAQVQMTQAGEPDDVKVTNQTRASDVSKLTTEEIEKCLPTNGSYEMLSAEDNKPKMADEKKIEAETHCAIYDVNKEYGDINEKYIVLEEEPERSLAMRMLIALTYPDLWCLALAVFGYGLTNSFFLIQLVSYMMSLGFTEASGAQTVVILGVSLMIGKVALVLGADYLPFHHLFLTLIASGTGIAVMVCLLQAHALLVVMAMVAVLGAIVLPISEGLPYFSANLVFGVKRGRETGTVLAFTHGSGIIVASLLGESLDRTGSYDLALFLCIGMYALCGLLCVMVPIYQRCFVRDRHVMRLWSGCGGRRDGRQERDHDNSNDT